MLVESKTYTMKGSKILLEALKNLGVDTIFGYPGGVVLDVYDELFKQSDIKHVLVRHEQSAVHAAEGYARETGKCGVVLVTSGPGATNTVTGIVNAYLDGYPLIVITGQAEPISTEQLSIFTLLADRDNFLNHFFELHSFDSKSATAARAGDFYIRAYS